MPSVKSRRRGRRQYRPVAELPPLPPEQFEALAANIALNGVLVPILVTADRQWLIDGAYRKQIADDLGYDCPEVAASSQSEAELRTLRRALNLARRQLTTDQKRSLIADQLSETPERSNRWIARGLGVSHATVASVRSELVSTGQVVQLDRTLGADGKVRPAYKAAPATGRSVADRRQRKAATKLHHGDCRQILKRLESSSVDCIVTDPIYPEVRRDYGRISEAAWHDLMRDVVTDCRRLLKPSGSMVIVLQPNYDKLGKMRLWLWEFLIWAGREWNLIQDSYWWAIDAMPLAGVREGYLRASVKTCVWLGPPNCFRNQARVLCKPSDAVFSDARATSMLQSGPSGRTHRPGRIAQTVEDRGGSTPFNLLPIATGGQPGGAEGHPAATPYTLADWWCRYLLPPGGVLLDPFCGSGTMLVAGLDNGASQVIGIDKEKGYLRTASKRVTN